MHQSLQTFWAQRYFRRDASLQPFQLNDAEENTRLLYPKRIQSFCKLNLFIYFETLGNWMLISLVFSVSSDRQGR